MAYGKRWRWSLSSLLVVGGILLAFGVAACQSPNRPLPEPTPIAATATPTVQRVTATPAPTLPQPTAGSTATAFVPAATSEPVATPATSASPVVEATRVSIATAQAPALPVRIVIPDLRLDAPVVEMGWRVVQTADGPRSDWVIPENQAGHHINSAALGEPGNLVISGHNNIYGRVFRPISLAWDDDNRTKVDNFTDQSDVLNGRLIELFDAAGKQYDYAITAFYRLKDTGVPLEQRIANARFVQPTHAAQVTLITCWPPTSNTHRLVVIANPAH